MFGLGRQKVAIATNPGFGSARPLWADRYGIFSPPISAEPVRPSIIDETVAHHGGVTALPPLRVWAAAHEAHRGCVGPGRTVLSVRSCCCCPAYLWFWRRAFDRHRDLSPPRRLGRGPEPLTLEPLARLLEMGPILFLLLQALIT